jgi:hypothetical protein
MDQLFTSVCQNAANQLNMSLEVFYRTIFCMMEEKYDEEDVRSWLDDHDYVYTDEDVSRILRYYKPKYDCDLGIWDNIYRAYDYAGLNLSIKD